LSELKDAAERTQSSNFMSVQFLFFSRKFLTVSYWVSQPCVGWFHDIRDVKQGMRQTNRVQHSYCYG